MSKLIKISKLAKDMGITTATIYNWRLAGKIIFTKGLTGRNFVTEKQYNKFLNIKIKEQEKRTVIYCRVSSSQNKLNLTTQRERLVSYCNAKGYKIHNIIEEIGSGLNDNRTKLTKLLKDADFDNIVVEHKDRLCRHGFNYIETLLKNQNKTIEIINNVDTDKEDIIQDFISIITSYCARIYGSRRNKRRTEQIIKSLNDCK